MGFVQAVVAVALLVVPVLFLVTLVRRRHATKVEWLVSAVLTAGFTGYVLLVGRWDVYSYYLRPALALALLVAVAISLYRGRRAPWWARPQALRGWLNLGAGVLVGVLFAVLVATAASGLWAGGTRPAELSFPLHEGVSYVGQGGASTLLNYHHSNTSQAYALDVVALNAAGRHAAGLAPAALERYAVFGRTVRSPCSGTVLEARDGLADLTPPTTDVQNRAGNHVVLRCAGSEPAVDVLLAHLRQGSVGVQPGAQVRTGQVLGQVGNTGNTSEPHLHVHAVRTGSGTVFTGQGVPLVFDGRFLVRNDLVVGN